jgi:hypothetical protein
MPKENLSTDTTFDPCWFSLVYTFNITMTCVVLDVRSGSSAKLCDTTKIIFSIYIEKGSLY